MVMYHLYIYFAFKKHATFSLEYSGYYAIKGITQSFFYMSNYHERIVSCNLKRIPFVFSCYCHILILRFFPSRCWIIGVACHVMSKTLRYNVHLHVFCMYFIILPGISIHKIKFTNLLHEVRWSTYQLWLFIENSISHKIYLIR